MEEYINNIDMQTISEQTLAFIGDAVYNVYVRSYLASVSTAKAGHSSVAGALCPSERLESPDTGR